jgi:hypothetical protein
MGKINATWHRAHPMPKNPTVDQRIEWHLAEVSVRAERLRFAGVHLAHYLGPAPAALGVGERDEPLEIGNVNERGRQ